MDISTLVSALSAAAAFLKEPIQGVTEKAVTDVYEKLKNHLLEKHRSNDLSDALLKIEQKPSSKARQGLLGEELEDFNVEEDPIVASLVDKIKQLLNEKPQPIQTVVVQQRGRGNRANVAGRDLIITEKHTKKVHFTPDESHITPAEGKKIKVLIEKLAFKLVNEEGKPNFQDAYGGLYRHLGVNSYREIKRIQFDEAISYLRQQGAINRSKLKRSSPQSYRNDLYAPIWAKQKELGWEKSDVYDFAYEKLALKKPISTLKKLGPLQLKHLYEHISRAK